jgi:hypothetical protein
MAVRRDAIRMLLVHLNRKGHHMTTASLKLQTGQALSLRDAAGVVLTSLAGRAWLTMEGDPRDIDLAAGVAYRIERDGLTLVNVLEPSVVEVTIGEARPSWRNRLESVWNWLERSGWGRARARMARGIHYL